MPTSLPQESLLKEHCYIDGHWADAISERRYPVVNPANGDVLAEVPDCSAQDTEQAVEKAHQAFLTWSNTTSKHRSQILRKWFDLIIEHQQAIAELMTQECGKPLFESLGEVNYGASFVEWFSEEAKRAYGDIIPAPFADRKILVQKQPVGVCSAITPWNFPLAMITRKCAPAIASGCTVVVKPAEATPLTALALAELAERAGLPSGVFNVVTASHGKDVGEVLSTHPLIRKISFTGSTGVGKLLLKQSAESVKRVSMELGGNAPFIVFDDADMDKAIEGAMVSKYRNTGQTCVCANRFIVHEDVYETFTQRLAERSAALVVGNGMDEGVQQGPLINMAAVEKVDSLVKDAVSKGGKVLTGGQPHELGGTFYQPTVLTQLSRDMKIAQEEIFGPVCPVFKFRTEEEAIEIANDTPYGLAAYFYSNDQSRVWRVASKLDYGMIGINEGIISTELAPFGGMKESGMGREGSKYGLDEYLEVKYLCMGGLDV
ncbi:NAD-dependent succinate-semialdehyde dehydrogenase [Litoribrevibacter albus]|uniref:NAD-dependent succinate-semialdehyde dehydrogenase n=1 Tax=Litoribrevibacter albus TaxID=1473156 RepID=A0AA37S6G3_9GAMM|nr:NAD-dependent succinate-semialdehyde dehydrogenase [Litoribrevibacter albus]GLQ29540.1 NAD-dependent succinate-semialdehyde dehydrogenase [Litoribrevibacter albus]